MVITVKKGSQTFQVNGRVKYLSMAFEFIKLDMIQTAFTRCRHILKTVKNSTDRPPVHTKTPHFFAGRF